MIEDAIYFSTLYDYYSPLLTEKQKLYFEDYYFNNLTLSEMAENYSISRNAIHKNIKETNNKLIEYEKKLHLKEKAEKIRNLITDEKLKEQIEEWI